MDKLFRLANMQEKIKGRGEDSDPLSLEINDSVILGVFDGMGGAGGSECPSDFSHDGVHMTKAYIASRIVKDAIETTIIEHPEILSEPTFADTLKDIIKRRYTLEKEKYPYKSKSSLRSSLIREYPTTLALLHISIAPASYTISSYWAGDSRNYIWNKNGLFQITVDDLKGDLDPMQNLTEDAPMSNCLQADSPFKINHRKIEIKPNQKFVVISATDGCFGYYPSPMDFEKALLDSLNKSVTSEEWNDNLCRAFAEVTADDFSFSMAAVGFKNFNELKMYLKKPSKLVKEYFRKRNYFEKQRVKKSEEGITRLREGIEKSLISLWPDYKKNYLKFISEDEER